MQKLFNLSDVSRALGVTPASVSAWLRDGVIPRPKYQVGNALAWTPQQLRRIKMIYAERQRRRRKE